MVTHAIIVAYFKELVQLSVHIKDYFRMDLKEITGSFRSSAQFPCLVLESHEGDLSGSSRMETVNERTLAFTIYDKPKKSDFDDQNDKLSSAEAYGLKVIARMRYNSNQPSHFLYNRFKVENVTYHKVGPIFNENLYGYRFQLTLLGNESLKLESTDWTDGPVICT